MIQNTQIQATCRTFSRPILRRQLKTPKRLPSRCTVKNNVYPGTLRRSPLQSARTGLTPGAFPGNPPAACCLLLIWATHPPLFRGRLRTVHTPFYGAGFGLGWSIGPVLPSVCGTTYLVLISSRPITSFQQQKLLKKVLNLVNTAQQFPIWDTNLIFFFLSIVAFPLT